MEFLIKVAVFAPPLLIAVILHEIAHGYAALKLGDPTARNLGRLSLNPLKHIDPYMTILIPGLLIVSGSPIVFGGAKPVPVDPRYFKNPRKGMAIVAIAGPITNFILATICYFTYCATISTLQASPSIFAGLIHEWLFLGITVNLVLGIFNLFPVPPLDGGRILVGLLPLSQARGLARVEPYGLLILIFCLFTGIIGKFLEPPLKGVITHLSKINSKDAQSKSDQN